MREADLRHGKSDGLRLLEADEVSVDQMLQGRL